MAKPSFWKIVITLIWALSPISVSANPELVTIGMSTVKESTTGEIRRSPDNHFWISAGENLFAFKQGGGLPVIELKLDGGAASRITFMGNTSESLGVIGTRSGWIYVLNQQGKIKSKKHTDDFFGDEAFRVSDTEFGLLSDNGLVHTITSKGEFVASKYDTASSGLTKTSKSSWFKNGTIMYSGYDQDDSGKPIYYLRILKPGEKAKEIKVSQMVNHAPGISCFKGQEVGILFGTRGLLKIVDDFGKDVLPEQQLHYFHEGGFAKVASSKFLASAVAQSTNQPKLISISSDGRTEEVMDLPTTTSSEFLVMRDPYTGETILVAGYLDAKIRAVKPEKKTIICTLDNSTLTNGTTLAEPVASETGVVIQRTRDLWWLNWQNIDH